MSTDKAFGEKGQEVFAAAPHLFQQARVSVGSLSCGLLKERLGRLEPADQRGWTPVRRASLSLQNWGFGAVNLFVLERQYMPQLCSYLAGSVPLSLGVRRWRQSPA